MQRKILFFSFLFSVLFFFSGCKEDPTVTTPYVNQFIRNVFNDVYLWKDEVPDVNIKKESDPFKLFDKLKYKDDRWSTLTDDVQGLNNLFMGTNATFGYSLVFYRIPNSEGVFAVIEYVYNDSPAMRAGLKRGDVIVMADNQPVTMSNYTDLVYASTLTVTLGKIENSIIQPTDVSVSMQAVSTYMNPVLVNKVIDKGAHKIGYLVYTSYLLSSHGDIKTAITAFKAAGVTDVVLDLRYNSGGASSTAQFLCSSLVPDNVLADKGVYLQQVWNDDYMKEYKKRGISTEMYYSREMTYLDDNDRYVTDRVDNIALSRVYILTSAKTASASEATIIGLMPYLDVVVIGGTTSGKYCGGIVAEPKHYNMSESDISNWGMYTMVYRFANKNGYPEHTGGIAPNYDVEENLLYYPTELGDENDPLLAKAMELITGESPKQAPQRSPVKFKYQPAVDLNIIPDGGFIDNGVRFMSAIN